MSDERQSRHSFLGNKYFEAKDKITIAIVGGGGIGSSCNMQLAHLEFKNIVMLDPQKIELANLPRLMGADLSDVNNETLKVDIAKRVVESLSEDSNFVGIASTWQEAVTNEKFLNADIIFSCLDTFEDRNQLENFFRPKGKVIIDMGMKVKELSDGSFRMFGQVVMSHPDGPCFKCLQYLSNDKLMEEDPGYGPAGIRPQIISFNNLLSSIAILVFIDVISNWTKNNLKQFYKVVDGNTLEIKEPTIIFEDLVPDTCDHF